MRAARIVGHARAKRPLAVNLVLHLGEGGDVPDPPFPEVADAIERGCEKPVHVVRTGAPGAAAIGPPQLLVGNVACVLGVRWSKKAATLTAMADQHQLRCACACIEKEADANPPLVFTGLGHRPCDLGHVDIFTTASFQA